MKRAQINQLFDQFEQAVHEVETASGSIECWSARLLQELLGYKEWRNFLQVIQKAKDATHNAGESISDHFVDVNKMVSLGSGAEREIEDIALTRYACYLIAQNGDSRKQEIAFAQTYFAVQTRKQELIEQRLLEQERVQARKKLKETEKKLSGIIYERGLDEKSFAIVRSSGDQALFGGLTTQDMKRKYKVPEGQPLADYLPTLTIKAKDFATELTSHNVAEKDLKGEAAITREHVDNNKAIRAVLAERGVKPEELPAEEDIKKVQRRLEGEEKKALKPKGIA